MLAAAAGMQTLPRTVLIAIDLDSPPIPTSRAISELLSEVSSVYLVNVSPPVASVERLQVPSWDRAYGDVLEESRDRVLGSLDLPPRVSQQLVTLTGNPVKEILSFADYARVDLIIVGQRRKSFLQRRFRTGLPTQILRATTCSVLVLPPLPGTEALPVMFAKRATTRTETIDRRTWSSRLADLSRRNEHRLVTLEIDDAELGAQVQAGGYPFMGVDHDGRDDRVAIMLGTRRDGGAHLTHFIERPTSIDVLEGSDRRLMALRIANASGQALLSFVA
jgi:nucleotide-binding universal stress UspA family protein